MAQDRNPQFVPLLHEVGPNKLGSDLIRVQSTAGGESIIWRLNNFQASWYEGFGVPGNTVSDANFQPGVLINNLYLDLSTGFLWYWNGTVWVQLTSGGGGGSCSPDDSIPGQILTVDVNIDNGGNWNLGDTFAVLFGDQTATGTVTHLTDGFVDEVTINTPGSQYQAGTTSPTIALTGSGTGLLIDIDTVTDTGTVGDYLYNGGGDCAGSTFFNGVDSVDLPSINAQQGASEDFDFMSLSALQIQFVSDSEESLTSTLTSLELSFSPNSFNAPAAVVGFGTYSGDGITLLTTQYSTEVELTLNGLVFNDFSGALAGDFLPAVNGNASTSIDFYGATSGTVKLTVNPIAGSTMPICLPDSDPAESGDVLVTDAGTGGDCWFGTGQQLSWASGGGGGITIESGQIAGGSGANTIAAIPGATFDSSGNITLAPSGTDALPALSIVTTGTPESPSGLSITTDEGFPLFIQGNGENTGSGSDGIILQSTFTDSGNHAGTANGILSQAFLAGTGITGNIAYALQSSVTANGTGNPSEITGYLSQAPSVNITGTLDLLTGIHIQNQTPAGLVGTITTQAGILLDDQTASGAYAIKTGVGLVSFGGTTSAPTLIESTTHTPSSASDTGITGQFAWDASFFYVCTAANTWKRTAIATW